MRKYVFSVGLAMLLLVMSGCGTDPEVQLAELSRNTVVYDEIVRLNNCGGKGDSDHTATREFATTIDIAGGVSLKSVVEGTISAKYSEYRNTSKSLRVVAPPGTNMEFVLRWSDDVRAGNVQVNGKSGTYEVRIPVSVEQISSRDLGCGAVSLPPSGQTAPVIPTANPIVTPSRSSGTSRTFTEEDLNALLGTGNWRCVDGFPNAISIDSLPVNFVVKFPLVRVDAKDKFYYEGDTVPDTGYYATGWLISDLPNNPCLRVQPRVTRVDIDKLLGVGNWHCLTDYPTGVKVVNVPSNFVVQRPVMYVDKESKRYYQGELVPQGGPATVWFPVSIASECP